MSDYKHNPLRILLTAEISSISESGAGSYIAWRARLYLTNEPYYLYIRALTLESSVKLWCNDQALTSLMQL